MRIPNACLARELGYVVLDDTNRKAYRVLNNSSYDLVLSNFYKDKESVFWPKVSKNKNKSSLLLNNDEFKSVEVEYLDHVLYWTEMSFDDIKKSLIFLCDISRYLADNDVYLTSHLWNVTLRMGKPYLIDLGDFRKGVRLMEIFDTITSTISEKSTHHIPEGYQPKRWIENSDEIIPLLHRIKNKINSKEVDSHEEMLAELKEVLLKIQPKNNQIFWDDYPAQLDMPNNISDLIPYAENIRPNLCKVIKEKKPETLLDLGCSRGLYSFYAASFGASTTGLDYSHPMMSDANKRSRELGVDCRFGFIDLLNLISWGSNAAYGNCLSRLRSEAVIAPALLHHVHGRGKPLDVLVGEWASCAKKWIMIEHIPNDTTGKLIDQRVIIDTLNSKGFTEVTVLDSRPNPRKWILGEKNDTNL